MLNWEQWRAKSAVSLSAARNSLNSKDATVAVSRAYYASFQMVTCVLHKLHSIPPARGHWGHEGSQVQFYYAICRRSTSQRMQLLGMRIAFAQLRVWRVIADYGDDSGLTLEIAENLFTKAKSIVGLLNELIERKEV
ncbi:HEPN domain-containing protein [Candidatus Poribacteria bacterium]|nr:HEPN domain-containing protein [Candidatus Poribacteria bacterium]